MFLKWRGLSLDQTLNNCKKTKAMVEKGSFTPVVYQPAYAVDSLPQLTVVSSFYGENESRYRAALTALEYLGRSKPLPRYLLVDGIGTYSPKREWPSFVETITISLPDDSAGIWLKESLLDIGIEKAFSDPMVEGVLLLDSDSAFCDLDWAVYVVDALSQYDVITPAIYIYSTGDPGVKGRVWVDGLDSYLTTGVYNLSTPYCSIGLTRDAFSLMGGRLPKNQRRTGDVDLIKKADSIGFRRGTAAQTLFHNTHDFINTERSIVDLCGPLVGHRLSAKDLVIWKQKIPRWADKEVLQIARETYEKNKTSK